MANFKSETNPHPQGLNRLYTILVSESAFFIWKIRCERRIQNNDDPDKFHTTTEIHNRWVNTMNKRLLLDQLMTNKSRYKKKVLEPRTILQTWDKVILNRENLPSNWIRQSGVLVGIRPQHPPGHNR